jgi:hypothetical protein
MLFPVRSVNHKLPSGPDVIRPSVGLSRLCLIGVFEARRQQR